MVNLHITGRKEKWWWQYKLWGPKKISVYQPISCKSISNIFFLNFYIGLSHFYCPANRCWWCESTHVKCGAMIINDGVSILEDLERELSGMKRKIRKRKKEYCSRPLVPKIRWQRLLRASDESIKCQPDVPGQPGQFYWKPWDRVEARLHVWLLFRSSFKFSGRCNVFIMYPFLFLFFTTVFFNSSIHTSSMLRPSACLSLQPNS